MLHCLFLRPLLAKSQLMHKLFRSHFSSAGSSLTINRFPIMWSNRIRLIDLCSLVLFKVFGSRRVMKLTVFREKVLDEKINWLILFSTKQTWFSWITLILLLQLMKPKKTLIPPGLCCTVHCSGFVLWTYQWTFTLQFNNETLNFYYIEIHCVHL